MNIVEVSFNWITGAMLGVEYVSDEDGHYIVADLLILRVIVSWGSE